MKEKKPYADERRLVYSLLKRQNYEGARLWCRGKLRALYNSRENELFRHESAPIADTRLPLVSILIPTWNRPELFKETFQSALTQSYPNVEVIVSDNSTNEETYRYMRGWTAHPRVTYFRNRTAKTKRENFLAFYYLGLLRSDYMQWLMDDDLIDADKTIKMIEAFLRHKNVTLVTSARRCIDANGRTIAPYYSLMAKDFVIYSGLSVGKQQLTFMGNDIGEPSTTLFRASDLKHNYWDASCRGYTAISDVVMWLELLEKGDLAYLPEPLSSFRIHEGQEQSGMNVILTSRNEWLFLSEEYYRKKIYIQTNDEYRLHLKVWREDFFQIRKSIFELPEEERKTLDRRLYERYRKNCAWIDAYLEGKITEDVFKQEKTRWER